MNKSRPPPANSNGCITDKVLFSAYQLWCW
uniref:Uncharacterized protein n=1 Tax=Arundo donax TaxID=35708 RepID=A0A0A8ZAL2_ARUDO